jgi:hypothetical protein
MTGLTRRMFMVLSVTLFYVNNQNPILYGGRTEVLDPTTQLGVYLFFVGSAMGIEHLSLIFGEVPSICSDVINKMLQLVRNELKNDPFAEATTEKNGFVCSDDLSMRNYDTSLHKENEWGLRSLQGTFPRYKKRLSDRIFQSARNQ